MTSFETLLEIAKFFRVKLVRNARGYTIVTASYDYFLPDVRKVEKKLYAIGAEGMI